jgi:rSAM/selenodomain-associated transferase 2
MHNIPPLLSIVIPTLNEAENLPALLEDLKKQQDILLEIIVGDGGSSDITRSVAEDFGVTFVSARRGRGAQMNAAALQASGDYFLFLHADSRIDDPNLLGTALHVMNIELCNQKWVAGHFCLRFLRTTKRNSMAYRYAEEKTAFNRVNTTNGDQGLLISRDFFRRLGGFDESLPFLEDQRIVEKIRSRGKLITLPGYLKTSARRFEAEGFHRRYTLMSMMMGLYSVGEHSFFVRAPGLYQVQQHTDKLYLSPFFGLIWRMMREDWGLRGSIRVFYLLGRYIRQNSWQLFYFIDVWLRQLLGEGRYPFLYFHDRVFAPCTNFKVFNAVVGVLCLIWFMGILAPIYRVIDSRQQKLNPRHEVI